MLLKMLPAAFASGFMLTSALFHPDLRLGLPEAQWRGMIANTNGHVSEGYVVVQRLQTRDGRTLVRWASTSALDPKGPNAIGVQVYSPAGVFQQWLNSSSGIDRNFVLCGPYLIGEGKSIRVWDLSKVNYPIVDRTPSLSNFKGALKCTDIH